MRYYILLIWVCLFLYIFAVTILCLYVVSHLRSGLLKRMSIGNIWFKPDIPHLLSYYLKKHNRTWLIYIYKIKIIFHRTKMQLNSKDNRNCRGIDSKAWHLSQYNWDIIFLEEWFDTLVKNFFKNIHVQ